MSDRFGKVAVLLGGPSSEREVSLMSGNAVLAALRERGVDAQPFDPAERDLWELKRAGFARAFIALHGRFGEDGTVQGALETLQIPYTGSGVMASALAMDKWRTKLVWLATGVPTPRYRVVDAGTDWMGVVAELGLPLIVKPAREGSTIGITKVAKVDHDELAAAYALAAAHDPLVLVEEFVAGQELTASIVNGRALPLIRIEAPHGNYDYHSKYFSDETKYFCPAGLPDAKEQEIRATCLRAFAVVGCSGWGRLDLILRADGSFSLLEVNTSPGMTGHSLVPMAARQAGIAFPDLCVEILRGARCGPPTLAAPDGGDMTALGRPGGEGGPPTLAALAAPDGGDMTALGRPGGEGGPPTLAALAAPDGGDMTALGRPGGEGGPPTLAALAAPDGGDMTALGRPGGGHVG